MYCNNSHLQVYSRSKRQAFKDEDGELSNDSSEDGEWSEKDSQKSDRNGEKEKVLIVQ